MKKLFFILSLFASLLFADEVNWQEDYATALESAKKQHKPVYVFISAGECPWCAKFENEVLTKSDIVSILNKNFINVHLVRGFDTIASQFKVRPVPRHYFLDKNGKIVFQDLGYKDKNEFKEELHMIIKEINR